MSNALITYHALYEGMAREAGERRAAYRALFRAHLAEAARDSIRKALNGGQALGNKRFREQVEAALGRRLSPKQRGRRRAEKANDLHQQMVLQI